MSELDYTTKRCSKCKEEKHVTDFHRNKRAPSGFQAACKECNCRNTRERDPNDWRKYNLKRNFGITPEQYEELLVKQDRSCAICLKNEDLFKKKLAVDHDHSTGRIRGLLCTGCNYHLVRRHRDGGLLRRMADYVEQGTDWFVPKKAKKPRKKKPSGTFHEI